jgi:hypothetical protein
MESRKRLDWWWVVLGAGLCLASAAGCSANPAAEASKQDAAPSSSGGTGSGGKGSGGTSAGGAAGSQVTAVPTSSGGIRGSGGTSAGGSKADALPGTGGGQGGAGGQGGSGGGTGTGGRGGATDAGASDGKPRETGSAGAGGGVVGTGGMTATGGTTGTPALDAAADPSRPIYAYGATVENTSADCQVPTLQEGSKLTSKISKLPDPFPKIDGTKISKRSEWRCRRQEILEQAKKYVFGDRPTPDVVTGSVTNNKISVHVEAQSKKIDFTADIVLPTKGQAPYPALISVGAKGGMGGLTMTESRITNEGVAVIYYDNYKLGKEGTAEQSRGKANPGLFYDIYGGTHSAGLLMAWSWGASRMIDVLQQSGGDIIDYQRLGVTGCSRLGKGAFVIGLFDERIALTIPQEPSTGGDPAFRIMDVLSGAERTDYNYNGLNWLSDNFAPFVYSGNTSNVVKLPIDTHSMIATMAPRGLLVLENPHQTQMGAPAGHMATLSGAEVYKALGVETNVSYHSSVADTNHCSWKTEYNDLLIRNITRFLKHETAKTGDILVGSGGSLKTSDWKEWTSPTLADDLPANWVLKE